MSAAAARILQLTRFAQLDDVEPTLSGLCDECGVENRLLHAGYTWMPDGSYMCIMATCCVCSKCTTLHTRLATHTGETVRVRVTRHVVPIHAIPRTRRRYIRDDDA